MWGEPPDTGEPSGVNNEGEATGLGEQIEEATYSNRREGSGWRSGHNETTVSRQFS